MPYVIDTMGEVSFGWKREYVPFTLPRSGAGYLAGESPDGTTTVQGVPQSAVVRILYRPVSAAPGDGVVVAEVVSAADGTWRVDGLNPALKFDVVGRKNGHNDVIVANVSPST
ncbi:hypothetical protein [uncultured Variovorax sp.]|uniref:hypothetical protein n=1 Tax=uncultured Variovorax sp. TaxID=114708 RepID=UPI0025E28A07|nr:hypothetical protein [uncultured Variovorax sp.]